MSKLILMTAAVLTLGSVFAADETDLKGKSMRLYISGYAPDITCFDFDAKTGEMKKLSTSPGGNNPSYMAFHPTGKFAYACNESNPEGKITAFSVNPADGALTKLNEESSSGKGPCHVSVHPSGKWAFSANYGSGTIGVLPIKEDGSVGAPSQHLEPGKNAHQIICDPSGKYVFVPCLGVDQVFMYTFDDKTGKLTPNTPATLAIAGTKPGPRHVVLSPNEKFGYIINELNSTMTACSYDASKGVLTAGATLSTLPAGFAGKNSTAHLVVTPNGKFVYGSNRGHNSIVTYAINPESGALTLVGHETGGDEIKTPRDFTIDPSGQFLIVASQGTNIVTVFKCNAETGALTKVHTVPVPKGPSFAGILLK